MEAAFNFFTEILKFLRLWSTNTKTQIEKVVTIYDTMHEVLEKTSVERFMIFKAHNGGGIIKPSGELYASCLYEDYTHPFDSKKSQYQKIELDSIYLRMLLDIMENHSIHLKIDEMKDGLLKGLYQGEGVKESRIYYLGRNKKYVFYCSLATSKDWILDQAQKTQLDLAVGKIKQNIT